MIDFMKVATRQTKKGFEVYPSFQVRNPSDTLMIRGGDFYAVWLDDKKRWSTSEQDAIELIDEELNRYIRENPVLQDGNLRVMHLQSAETGMIDTWHKFCQKQMRDTYHMLDENLIFSNDDVSREDYASKTLPYPLEKGDISAWDRLIDVLYSEEERHKIEWCIGAIVTGASKKLQKFMVLYGAAGTGKSTIIKIIEKLFKGYTGTFNSQQLGSASNVFALECFKTNPLVALENDGDLSKIEDNTRLNSLVSHEEMSVNEKFKSTYTNSFKSFLIMGSNKPVKITDAKSGLLRRLIDVTPTGNKLSFREYTQIMNQIDFELGAIAWHCKEVYEEDPSYYDDYIPTTMMGATNDFYNFVEEYWNEFKNENETTLKLAWERYNTYCEKARVLYPFSMRVVKEELKNYFDEYLERFKQEDGSWLRSYYRGFKVDKFNMSLSDEPKPPTHVPEVKLDWLDLKEQHSILDDIYADCPAQYASDEGRPFKRWDNVKTKLRDLDTSRLHFTKTPDIHHIVADFDQVNDNGEKSLEKNLEEAAKWPPTYAELSKSGYGIHLHYIYSGDPSELSCIYDNRIEIKVYSGGSSLRRKVTRCNDLPIATISHGLPLKEVKKTVNFDSVQSQKGLERLIERNLRKEIHPGTKPSVEFIAKILDDAYNGDLSYDISIMKPAIIAFAAKSTHHADYCLKLVNRMRFMSSDHIPSEPGTYGTEAPIVFYDVEVFPNLLLVNWKKQGEGNSVVRMINPTPVEIEKLVQNRLIGFNCRRYDNHILYARMLGWSNEQIYKLSLQIVSDKNTKNCFFSEAYNLSYTDVYDFSSKKQSLKKFEIELGIHHQELGLPWDQPVPEDMWEKVAEYCDNDVIATEKVFESRKSDWLARQILADIAEMTVNDTTNSLTTRIIFGTNKKPQDQFNYRFMGDEIDGPRWPLEPGTDEYTIFDTEGRPHFPGYTFENGKSVYRDEEVGEGGYVYAEPGMYGNVALLDIASMHPSSIMAEQLFGPTYTKRYGDILQTRIFIKHDEFDKARLMFDGKLNKYLDDEESAKNLAQALKIAINSVYGLTSAKFENPFRDIRNVDNIVAKRGALFMVNLKHEVQKKGFTVAHIKTDSIKIPDATPEIIQFVMDYGKIYGYNFEHEATYDKMCLVNDAVYIARYKDGKHAGEWTATGAQFAVPYVFKTLFSREPIGIEDMCEAKSATADIFLDMNEGLPDVSQEEDILKKGKCTDEERIALENRIISGHDYHFVGKVGEFCPIKPGKGGGVLYRKGTNGYSAVTGTKGYRWLESETVRENHLENDIDRSYYDALVNSAKDNISQYGDFEWFASDTPYDVPPEG